MKKFWKSMMFAALGVFALSSCEDVPAPYDIPGQSGGKTPTVEGGLPYTSSNLNADWTKHAVTENDPWSQGANYTQATGYQAWDGGSKSNKEVEGYLISPSINTTAESGKVKFSFDQTLRYENNDKDYAKHCLIYVSNNYDGENFGDATWTLITDFTVTPSTTNDWTLYTSGEMQLPDDFVNQENVHFAFYFYAPASGSTTWELQSFKVEEGVAGEKPDTPDSKIETEGEGTLESPYTVADALKIIEAKAYTSDKVYIKGKIVSLGDKDGKDVPGNSYGNATYFISDDGKADNQLEIYRGYGLGGEKMTTADYIKVGDEVIVLGTLTLFYETPEVNQGSEIVELNGKKPEEKPDTPTGEGEGDGSETSPYNVTAAFSVYNAGGATNVWVKGYIVGYVDGQVLSSGAKFSGTNATSQTNILIAQDADETDYNKCIPVQLPAGDVRSNLNLKDNPDNYKAEVSLYGNIEKYFGVAGLKSVTKYSLGEGGGPDTPNTPTEGTAYTLATTATSGTYLIAANISDDTYQLATDLGTSKTYGYLSGTSATATDKVITTDSETVAWTITAVDGGYTIQDSNNRYLYMTGTYNSFNVDASQKEGYIWSITVESDGTATITNKEKNKTIQWSTQYNSYGSYSTTSGIKPRLFKK